MAFVGRFSAYNDLLRFQIGCCGPYVKSIFVVSDCPVEELLATKGQSLSSITKTDRLELVAIRAVYLSNS